jgi:glutathione S-transferase
MHGLHIGGHLATIRLIGAAQSRAIRVIWMLNELGLQYEHDPITPSDPRLKAPPYSTLNPNGRIPTLQVDDFAIYESLAINLYLAQKFPGETSPRGVEEQALAVQWSCWAMSDVDPLVTIWALNTLIKPEAQRDSAAAADARQQLERPLQALNASLENRTWLIADRFTVADLNVAAVLNRALNWEMDATPNVKPWLQRCWARDAAIAARRARGDKV